METKRGKRLLTDDLELRIIEIPKAERILEKEVHNRIAQWLTFINNPNTERVEKIMKENKEVKKAKSVLHVMSKDEELQRLAELKEKWERDERSAQEAWKENGIEEGRKEGRKAGRLEGRLEGLLEGRLEGEKSKAVEIAKTMKEKNMNINEIIEITGLTKEEIENI